MLNRIISWSLNNRLIVLVLALILVGTGIWSMRRLPLDAFPDITPVLVQVNTVAPSLSAEEIEQQVTFPIEQAISGLDGLKEVRSLSKFGFSQVTIIFEGNVDVYLARQMVMERLQTVELPQGISRPSMGPVATGLGEVYHYILTSDKLTLTELTTIQNWIIKPRLASVPGVAEVNTWGGKKKEYHLLVDPDHLNKYSLTLDEVTAALKKNNLTVGGGYLSQGGEMHIVQGMGLVQTVEEIEKIVISSQGGVPLRVRDLGEVKIRHQIRRGGVTYNGEGEAVLGLGFMLMGQNSRVVTQKLQEKMKEIQASLPEGVTLKEVYLRTDLVSQVMETVKENLLEGALLVIAVLFIFLGNFRAGLIVASAIPLSMLFAFNMMLQAGIAGSLLSLGAIDFGLIVDSSVISIENSARRLSEAPEGKSKLEIVKDAAIEVRKPTMFGELIIMIVFLPILTLQGIEGRLFRPMALTMIFALLASMILSLTLVPVLASFFLSKSDTHTKENPLVRFTQWLYRPVLRLSVKVWYATVGLAILLLAGGLFLSSRLGAEFVPRLSEMSLVINTVRLSGVSLEESLRYSLEIEKVLLKEFPDEIDEIWTRTGAPEVTTDPMGIEVSDVFITLKPRSQWKRAQTQAGLVKKMNEALAGMPGMRTIFMQPIEMRVNEMVAGIRSDLGVKIFGDDLEVLKQKASEVEEILKSTQGSADVYSEQITGLPVLEVRLKQEALSRHGISSRRVLELVEALGGTKVTEVREGQRRFDLLVRLPRSYRENPASVRNLWVNSASGQRVPLTELAWVQEKEGPSTITREWQKRRIVVQCNVRERDLASFVKEVQKKINGQVSLPLGYHVNYGGQYEHLQSSQQRLMLVVPAALFLIFFLLYLSTESMANTLIIFTGAPFATLGGILALWIRDMPFTISAAVGFIAVSGVAMLNGLVLVSTIQQKLKRGIEADRAIEESALQRMRPVLMTALVAALGFVPMALNTGVGAEVQRPLATVVIGGVISDTTLTLLVLPALYWAFGSRKGED